MKRGWLLLLLLLLAAACSRPRGEGEGELHTVHPDSLAHWMEVRAPLVLLDLRPDSLYHASRLPGAVGVNGLRVAQFRDVLPVDINAAIVFYTQDGTPPPDEENPALRMVETFRFRRVYWLTGGITAWMERGHGTDGFVHPDGR